MALKIKFDVKTKNSIRESRKKVLENGWISATVKNHTSLKLLQNEHDTYTNTNVLVQRVDCICCTY